MILVRISILIIQYPMINKLQTLIIPTPFLFLILIIVKLIKSIKINNHPIN